MLYTDTWLGFGLGFRVRRSLLSQDGIDSVTVQNPSLRCKKKYAARFILPANAKRILTSQIRNEYIAAVERSTLANYSQRKQSCDVNIQSPSHSQEV